MLYYNTVNNLLKNILETLMSEPLLDSFRLVGGTSLSLQIGHRVSIDIDMFSDATYGSINFRKIETCLKSTFSYVEAFSDLAPALGKSFSIGIDEKNVVKVDFYYTDPFIQPPIIAKNNIRLATIEEIIAMKVDVIQRGGRKKDFWDLHAVIEHYGIEKMIELHQLRYEYTHDKI